VTTPAWSATKLKTWHACPRRYQYRYVLGLGEPPTDAQRYGTAVHAALEAWLLHHHEGSEARLAAALAAIQLSDPWEAARARAIVLGYELRWSDTRWRVIAVEQLFQYELGGHILQGQIDAIVEDLADGRVYVVEHKNASNDTSPGSAYWERLAIDTQVSVYVDGASLLGYGDVAGVIYDVLVKPKHEPKLATPDDKRSFTTGKGCKWCGGRAGGKGGAARGLGVVTVDGANHPCPQCKGTGWSEEPRLYAGQRDADEPVDAFEARLCEAIAENPDSFYRRGIVVRTDDELPRMRTDILDTIKLARAAELFEVWPRNSHSCTAYGSTCYFMPLCNSTSGIDDLRWSTGGRDASSR
jgi:hypothetical protein